MKNKIALLATSMLAFGILSSSTAGAQSPVDKPAENWEWCGWGGGGFFWSCVWHPTDSNIIYLGGDVAGIYKSVDKGKNWKFINKGISDYGVYSIAISKSKPDILYIGTMGGVCKTMNGGTNWTFLEQTGKDNLKMLPERPRSVRAIAIDPSNPDIVYMGSSDGKIYRTEDGGANWKKLYETATTAEGDKPNKKSIPISSICIAETNSKLIFASSVICGILRSEDAGATWTQLSTPKASMCVVVAPYDEKTVYAAFDKEGIMKSADKGQTWGKVKLELPEGSNVREIVLHPANPKIIQCIIQNDKKWNGNFSYSIDGGESWTTVAEMKADLAGNPSYPNGVDKNGNIGMSKISNLSLNPSNPDEMFIAANRWNCFSSDGGRTWENRDAGADITCFTDLQFSGDKVYATAMDEGLLVTSDGGKLWKPLFPLKWALDQSGHQWQLRVIRQETAERIISTLDPHGLKTPACRVIVSEDGGATFKATTKGIPEQKSSTDCMWGHSIPRAMAVDPRDPKIIYLGIDGDPEPDKGVDGGGIFKSVDGGYSWERLPNQPASRRMFYGLAVCPADSNRIYWATCGDRGGLYRTEDGGKSWSKVFDKESWLFNVSLSSTGDVYTGKNDLWKSTDHGQTWQKLSNFKNNGDIVGISIDPGDEKRIWISKITHGSVAEGAVLRTVDGGVTWEDITGDLPYRKPRILRYNPRTKELWAAGNGIFKIRQ
ncbi:MAG TPA: hypothetical protein DCZ94_17185 [Lentisphaeria bacterium]|nr:MAG: hypothetical protein A2X48_20995 [Lentisphaerae bacterium GWF2_49_21]HBC88680.1 hypothetical protein [Lentisphaeria bacterium]